MQVLLVEGAELTDRLAMERSDFVWWPGNYCKPSIVLPIKPSSDLASHSQQGGSYSTLAI